MADIKQINSKLKTNSSKIIVGALFILTFVMGWIFGHQDAQFGNFGFSPNIVGRDTATPIDFSIFWRTWDLLTKNFDGKLDYQNMVYGAVKGMVDSLGDPYTAFLKPDEAKALEDELSGTFSGIGAEVGIKNNVLTVIAPIDDSPAKKAGVLSGDVILKIDDQDTKGMDVNKAVSKIRGQAGTKVKLLIQRNNVQKEYEIERAQVSVKSVKSEIKNGNIGYVSISRFDDGTTDELRTALRDFNNKKVKKVILDLRDNPGGYLDEAVTVSSEFIKSGIVVSERKDIISGKPTEYRATGEGEMTDTNIKLVVLVNEGSASASEIVAGALKDHKRATLIGVKTFGKGSVQEIQNLPGGAKLRVTVAHWYTPNGKNISKEGIAPDVEVKMSDTDYNTNKDPQLDRAILFLNQ